MSFDTQRKNAYKYLPSCVNDLERIKREQVIIRCKLEKYKNSDLFYTNVHSRRSL